jgi:hypothetical protein
MNLYLISQRVRYGYDTYDSAVVAASSEEEARYITPKSCQDSSMTVFEWELDNRRAWSLVAGRSWALYPSDVEVKLLGKATKNTLKGVICASFNAG